jgi:hypothetical protein
LNQVGAGSRSKLPRLENCDANSSFPIAYGADDRHFVHNRKRICVKYNRASGVPSDGRIFSVLSCRFRVILGKSRILHDTSVPPPATEHQGPRTEPRPGDAIDHAA